MIVVSGLLGCATSLRAEETRSPKEPDVERLRATVQELSSAPYEGRGTALGKRKTRAYLIERFRTLGLKPLFANATYEQEIPGPRDWNAPPDSPRPLYGHNVGAWLPFAESVGQKLSDDDTTTVRPPEEIVIVSAHFDHLGIVGGRLHPGADDNASGVAMLLETARLLAARKLAVGNSPRVAGIAFLAFDLEEYALWGSRWFAAHLSLAARTGATVHDRRHGRPVVGGPAAGDGFRLGNGTWYGSSRAGPRRRSAGVEGRPPAGSGAAGDRHRGNPRRLRSVPGRGGAVPVLLVGRTSDYHTPRDNADRVDFDKVAAVTRVFADVAWQIALDDERPVWREAEPLGHEEARTIRRIAVLLLERDEVAKMEGRAGLATLAGPL